MGDCIKGTGYKLSCFAHRPCLTLSKARPQKDRPRSMGGRGPRTAFRIIWEKAQGTRLGIGAMAQGPTAKPPPLRTTALTPRPRVQGQRPRGPWFKVPETEPEGPEAEIQMTRANVDGIPSVPVGPWANWRTQNDQIGRPHRFLIMPEGRQLLITNIA